MRLLLQIHNNPGAAIVLKRSAFMPYTAHLYCYEFMLKNLLTGKVEVIII